jgi:predicted acetyltransferase
MELIVPTKKYKDSFLEAFVEFSKADEVGFWKLEGMEMPPTIEEYIDLINSFSKGENLFPGWVPATTYWLIDNDEFIGHINIRHTLNDGLKKIGGHIGYAIRPPKRQQGYGKEILKKGLPKAKAIGIKQALVTCDDNNIGSKKIIETNGGIFEKTHDPQNGDPIILHYRIDLEQLNN